MRTLGVIDSDAGSLSSANYITYSTCLTVPKEYHFNYAFSAYVVEAQLSKSQRDANPGLKHVRLCSRGACTAAWPTNAEAQACADAKRACGCAWWRRPVSC